MTIENAARWFRFSILPYLVKADIACAECGRPYWVAEGQSLKDGWRCDRCVSAAPKSQRTSKPIAVSDILFGAFIGCAMLGVVIIVANATIVPQPCRSPFPDQCDTPSLGEWAAFIGFVAFVLVGLAAMVAQTIEWNKR